MFLSKIELHSQAANNPDFWRRFSSEHSIHKMVWEFFAAPDRQQRDFLYRLEGRGPELHIYTVSADPPLTHHSLWLVRSKEFKPELKGGDRLAFRVRVNPTVKHMPQGKKQGQRHDVIMDAKHQARQKGTPLVTSEDLVHTQGVKWLEARAGTHGFIVNPQEVRCFGYEQVRTGKGRGEREARLSTVEMEGLLTVKDADAFVETLHKGLGPAKGFGCGLMLIRRA